MTRRTPARKSALEYAVNALTRRAYSSAELRKKMLEKQYAPQETESVLQLFLAKGFLNDTLYAENMASALQNRGDGKKKIAGKLHLKGISPEIISGVLEAMEQETPEEEAAFVSLLKKKNFLLRETDGRKRKEKALRHLCSRGFSVSSAFSAWERFLQEKEL